MFHVKTRAVVPMMLAVIVTASCGIVPSTLRKTTLERNPGFAASAHPAQITVKRPTAWSGNIVHKGDYALPGTDTSSVLQFAMEAKWEKAEAFKLRPKVTILGYEIASESQEKMQGLRLSVTKGDTSDLEVIGIIRRVKEEFPTRGEVPETFTTFPCQFEMFRDGASFGAVTLYGPWNDSYSHYRKFGFSFDEREYTLVTQSYQRLTYSTIESDGALVALIELKPKSGKINTRGGDFLIGDDVSRERQGDLLKMMMIADVFTHSVFGDDS